MSASSRPTAFRFTRQLGVAVTTCLAAFGLAAVPALAATAEGCAPTPLSTPFAQFGDSAQYGPVAGGSFESGAAGWSLSNATVVAGNESYEVAGGSHSLAIQPTGAAVSPAFCVSTADPSFGFFARRTSGSWGALNVILRWTDADGAIHNTTVASLQSGTSWTPIPVLKLASALPLWQPRGTLNVALVFKPEQYGGAWAIDDVYIDPRMS